MDRGTTMSADDREHRNEIREKEKEWAQGPLKNILDSQKEREKEFQTISGIPVKRLYTPLDLEERGFNYLKDLGFPGEYPHTRGQNAAMYRTNFWNFGSYAGFGTPEQTHERFQYLLRQGTSFFGLAWDLPTQMGLDSDHPLAQGEVGKVGTPIDSLQDVEVIFHGILDKALGMGTVASSTGPIALAMFIAVGE